jgi:hypothetical protein
MLPSNQHIAREFMLRLDGRVGRARSTFSGAGHAMVRRDRAWSNRRSPGCLRRLRCTPAIETASSGPGYP